VSARTFSVLVPAYNAEATVAAAIRSALAQTRSDFEIIVVDDGSTDATAEVVRPFLEDRRVALIQQENRGLAGARNTALARAHGEYVSLLDSDDLLLPDYMERMAAALESDPGAAFAYGDAWAFDDVTKRVRRASAMAYQRPPATPPQDPHALVLELLRRNFVFVCATIRRSVLEEVGPFDASLRSAEDYELWLRIALRGYRAVRVEGQVALYRLRPGQLSADPLNMLRHLRDVYRLVAQNLAAPDEVRTLACDQAERMERGIATVSGDGRARAARYRARLGLGRVKRALIGRRLWYGRPPPEVASAFPDLEAL
jgi:glycosyltransferase involved in cell wall biosynthesis